MTATEPDIINKRIVGEDAVKNYFLCLFSKRIVCKSEPEVHFYRKLRYARED